MAQAYPYLIYTGAWRTKQDKCVSDVPLDRARIWLDFNELCAEDGDGAPVFLFSQGDVVNDSAGEDVLLYEGQEVSVFDSDLDEAGQPDPLLAEGVLFRNTLGAWPGVKWLIRLCAGPRGGARGGGYVYWLSDLQ